ncbi:MAG: GIY-YIG nuclease family protein [Candidatus Omnitrophica bacterium]|nr:GIY-YIG nuclease family protein [Candidatus Omnitrophota bacterium]
MAFVYILESLKTGRYYIGSTNDAKKRLESHNAAQVPATRNFRPYRQVFLARYDDMKTARRVELRLKGLKRRDYIAKIIESGKITF